MRRSGRAECLGARQQLVPDCQVHPAQHVRDETNVPGAMTVPAPSAAGLVVSLGL
jgi:hypothetical protein